MLLGGYVAGMDQMDGMAIPRTHLLELVLLQVGGLLIPTIIPMLSQSGLTELITVVDTVKEDAVSSTLIGGLSDRQIPIHKVHTQELQILVML